MTQNYKLPKCWLGQYMRRDGGDHVITEEEINPNCTCPTPINAFWCAEGHMTECHKGMTCEEAQCSHLVQYQNHPGIEGDE